MFPVVIRVLYLLVNLHNFPRECKQKNLPNFFCKFFCFHLTHPALWRVFPGAGSRRGTFSLFFFSPAAARRVLRAAARRFARKFVRIEQLGRKELVVEIFLARVSILHEREEVADLHLHARGAPSARGRR